ncbi:MAG: TIR domain-containing protein [Anaerolineae bacterium]|nr:TIR domain-containing protein [Anaerolineae bacterium]
MSNGSYFQRPLRTLDKHNKGINRLAWSPVRNELASTSFDRSILIWDLTDRSPFPRIRLEGHRDWVSSVAWSPDGEMLASSSGDNTVRLWNVHQEQSVGILTGHGRTVFDLDWSHATNALASVSGDGSVAVWNPYTADLIALMRGHSGAVYSVAWRGDGRTLATGSEDHSIRIWDVEAGQTRRVLEGHGGAVYALAWSPDNELLASASADYTIRIWGRRTTVLEMHTGIICDIGFSADGSFLASKSLDGTVRVWRTDTWECVSVIDELAARYWTAGLAFHPKQPVLATLGFEDQMIRVWKFDPARLRDAIPVETVVRYTNAKVVLVGDSGVGKTSLAEALCERPFRETTDSTHGRQVHRFHSEETFQENVSEQREILLWDMAGQPGYRLIHQLHLNEVVLALVMFSVMGDGDPFTGVRHWDRALKHAELVRGHSHVAMQKFLVAGRIDRGGQGVSRDRIELLLEKLGFNGYYATSARDGYNIPELASAIRNAIPWDQLPKVNSTRLFQRIKNYLTGVRDDNHLLHTIDQLYDTFAFHNEDIVDQYPDLRIQFETCISLVESQGLIKRFSFGNLVLLKPEMVDAYASALITAARDEAEGLGLISEKEARAGNFRMSEDERIDNKEEEELLLIATIEDLIKHEIAIRDEEEEGKVNIIFPSQSSRLYQSKPPEPDANTTIWQFEGAVLNIYTTLLVRMWNTGRFQYRDNYENAAFYTTANGTQFKLFLFHTDSGEGELQLFTSGQDSAGTRTYIEEYINVHLLRRALPRSVKRRVVTVCGNCGTVMNDTIVRKRLQMKKSWLNCPVCDNRISLVKSTGKLVARQSFVRQQMVTRLDQDVEAEQQKQMLATSLEGRRKLGEFDVFICHNHQDRLSVTRIAEQLTHKGVLPWLDLWDLRPGDDWEPAVRNQLKRVNNVAFFIGLNGIGEYQLRELQFALMYEAHIIPVLLPDAPRRPDIPITLAGRSWVDFRDQNIDPLQHLLKGILGDQNGNDQLPLV